MGIKTFKVIDYSESYFEKSGKSNKPDNRGGKFIQVSGDEGDFIVFSPLGHTPYHANIAEHFFRSKSICGAYNPQKDHYTHQAPGWKIVGGGHWSIDERDMRLELFGTSIAYGRFDADGLAEKLKEAPEFRDFMVIVDKP